MFAGIKFPAREPTTLKNNSDSMEKDGAEYRTYNSSVPVVPHDAVLARAVTRPIYIGTDHFCGVAQRKMLY